MVYFVGPKNTKKLRDSLLKTLKWRPFTTTSVKYVCYF